MNLLDIIILIAMVFFILKGLYRGPVREVASLAGVIAGIWVANLFHPQMSNHLKSYLPPTQFLPLISFSAIFASVLFLSNLTGWFLRLLFMKAFLGWAGRTLGAGLAILKGVIIIHLFMILLTFFLPSRAPLIAKSKLAPLIIVSYQSMTHLIYPDLYQKLKDSISGKQ